MSGTQSAIGDDELAAAAAGIDSAAAQSAKAEPEAPAITKAVDEEEEEEEVKEPPSKRQKTETASEEKMEAVEEETAAQEDEAMEEEEPKPVVAAATQEEEKQPTATQEEEKVEGGGQATIGQLKKIKEKVPFTDEEAESTIAEWMEKQNRPYSVQNLLDNFQHQLKRPQCIRIMDQLTENQILTCKEFGKAKVYMINQDLFPETNQDQLTMLDQQIQVRKEEFDGLVVSLKKKQESLKGVTGQGESNEAIAKKLKEAKAALEAFEVKLKPFIEGGAKLVTEAELQKAEKECNKWQLEWKKKRRATYDVVNALSESMDMDKKVFISKTGIETDEENNVVCPK